MRDRYVKICNIFRNMCKYVTTLRRNVFIRRLYDSYPSERIESSEEARLIALSTLAELVPTFATF